MKFDDTNNFDMWRCKVTDALTTTNLEDVFLFDKKPEKISEKDWDEMNQTVCGVIRSYLTQEVSCDE